MTCLQDARIEAGLSIELAGKRNKRFLDMIKKEKDAKLTGSKYEIFEYIQSAMIK